MHSENLEAPWIFKYQVGLHLHCFNIMANALPGLLMQSTSLINNIQMVMWFTEGKVCFTGQFGQCPK